MNSIPWHATNFNSNSTLISKEFFNPANFAIAIRFRKFKGGRYFIGTKACPLEMPNLIKRALPEIFLVEHALNNICAQD